MPATALLRSSVGSHHQSSGARVIIIQELPSGWGSLWTRMSTSFSSSPTGFSQKSTAYFFCGCPLFAKDHVGKPAECLQAAHHANAVELERKRRAGFAVAQGKDTVLAAGGDDFHDRGADVIVTEVFGCRALTTSSDKASAASAATSLSGMPAKPRLGDAIT